MATRANPFADWTSRTAIKHYRGQIQTSLPVCLAGDYLGIGSTDSAAQTVADPGQQVAIRATARKSDFGGQDRRPRPSSTR